MEIEPLKPCLGAEPSWVESLDSLRGDSAAFSADDATFVAAGELPDAEDEAGATGAATEEELEIMVAEDDDARLVEDCGVATEEDETAADEEISSTMDEEESGMASWDDEEGEIPKESATVSAVESCAWSQANPPNTSKPKCFIEPPVGSENIITNTKQKAALGPP
jgi:hypothetical protein